MWASMFSHYGTDISFFIACLSELLTCWKDVISIPMDEYGVLIKKLFSMK